MDTWTYFQSTSQPSCQPQSVSANAIAKYSAYSRILENTRNTQEFCKILEFWKVGLTSSTPLSLNQPVSPILTQSTLFCNTIRNTPDHTGPFSPITLVHSQFRLKQPNNNFHYSPTKFPEGKNHTYKMHLLSWKFSLQ